jgi:hypothetical protein
MEIQKFDGMSVDLYEGKFSGSFECDSLDASDVRIDDELYYLVRVRAKGASMDETRNGDLRRTNVFAVSDAVRIDNDTAFKISTQKNAQLLLAPVEEAV